MDNFSRSLFDCTAKNKKFEARYNNFFRYCDSICGLYWYYANSYFGFERPDHSKKVQSSNKAPFVFGIAQTAPFAMSLELSRCRADSGSSLSSGCAAFP